MNNIDNWLNSLGFDDNTHDSIQLSENTQLESSHPGEELSIVSEPGSAQEEPEVPDNLISFDDLDAILADNGLQAPEFDEAEEVTDTEREDRGEEEEEEEDTEYSPDEVFQDPMEALSLVTQEEPPAQEPLIPQNSPTLLLNEATSRFSGTEWYNEMQKQRIILAGCGGIGSWAILQLARMNPEALCIYDDDMVEMANMSGQLYCHGDIGKSKVDAMVDMITSYTTMRSIYAIKDKFTPACEAGDVMICGFDNMEARQVFYNKWLEHVLNKPEEERHKCLMLDGRLSVDTLQVFCLTGDNEWALNEYQSKCLFSDAEAEATQCSLKQTTYLACMIGSVIVNLFTNWVASTLNPVIPYDLPFFTEYDAQNMIFKTIK